MQTLLTLRELVAKKLAQAEGDALKHNNSRVGMILDVIESTMTEVLTDHKVHIEALNAKVKELESMIYDVRARVALQDLERAEPYLPPSHVSPCPACGRMDPHFCITCAT